MSDARPNLIYVFADQLRYSAMGYAGDPYATTPTIDAFARSGVNFSNAVATAPFCTAYRASLLTGKYTTSHGMVINELRINPNQHLPRGRTRITVRPVPEEQSFREPGVHRHDAALPHATPRKDGIPERYVRVLHLVPRPLDRRRP